MMVGAILVIALVIALAVILQAVKLNLLCKFFVFQRQSDGEKYYEQLLLVSG